MKPLTVIIPAYNEAYGIEATIEAIAAAFTGLAFEPTFLIIDDGSTDETWHVLTRLKERDPRVGGISFSRNFGKERAIHAGLCAAKTDVVIVMDADLQHPPGIIPRLVETYETTGCDVVHGVKIGRDNESVPGQFLVHAFYRIYHWCSGTNLTGTSDFKLLGPRALQAYRQLTEHELFFRGLVPWLGFHQEAVTFTVAKRAAGRTTWSGRRRLQTALNAVTSFSSFPLQVITVIGFLFLSGAVALALYSLFEWLNGNAPAGYTTLILLLLIIGSVLMISLGIIGQYLAHIYNEVKERPAYIIKDTL